MQRHLILALAVLLVPLASVPARSATLTSPFVAPAQGWANSTPFQFAVKYTDPTGNPPQGLRLYLLHPNKQTQEIQMDVSAVTEAQAISGALVKYRLPRVFRAGTYGYYFSAATSAGDVSLGSARAPFHFVVRNLWLEFGVRTAIALGSWLLLFLLYQYLLIKKAPVGRIPALAVWTFVTDLLVLVFLFWYLLALPPIWVPIATASILLLALISLLA